jgi:nucleotide-binding universal stress UspA family protein
LTRGRGLQAELRSIDGVAAVVVPQYARYADLCILGRDEPEGPASVNYTFSEHLLFVTGRPVLFVPPEGSFEKLGRHIAVAWNSSRPAARSLNDALPLIERAERTTVLMVNPSGFIDAREGPSGEQMVEHLRVHGATVDAIRIENVTHGAIADRLQAEAHALGADMIVAGAFGHPRLWEKMLGGVTHDLIARMSLPIFMSHQSKELDTLAAAGTSRDIHAEMLELLTAARQTEFKHELVGAAVVFGGAIEGDERRHFGGEALLEIGRLEHAAPDVYGAMRGRRDEPDGRQRTRSTIRPNVGVDADTHVLARHGLYLALDRIALRVGRGGRHAQQPSDGKAESTYRKHRAIIDCQGINAVVGGRLLPHGPVDRSGLACRLGSA